MNISANTPQYQLCKLTRASTRAYVFNALPITGRGLRTTLLFILFPGMLFGFWKGLMLTGAVTIAMMIALAMDDPSINIAITRGYLIWGVLTAFGVAGSILMGAIKEAKLRRQYIQPIRPCEQNADLIFPQQHSMHVKAVGDAYHAEIEFEAPVQGIYTFIIELQHCDWAGVPQLQGNRNACILEWRKQERPESAFFAYRLEAGIHQISIKLGVVKSSTGRPKAQITQINDLRKA